VRAAKLSSITCCSAIYCQHSCVVQMSAKQQSWLSLMDRFPWVGAWDSINIHLGLQTLSEPHYLLALLFISLVPTAATAAYQASLARRSHKAQRQALAAVPEAALVAAAAGTGTYLADPISTAAAGAPVATPPPVQTSGAGGPATAAYPVEAQATAPVATSGAAVAAAVAVAAGGGAEGAFTELSPGGHAQSAGRGSSAFCYKRPSKHMHLRRVCIKVSMYDLLTC
jgi:hypothetical protein